MPMPLSALTISSLAPTSLKLDCARIQDTLACLFKKVLCQCRDVVGSSDGVPIAHAVHSQNKLWDIQPT